MYFEGLVSPRFSSGRQTRCTAADASIRIPGGRASERESESSSGGEAGQAGIESSQNNADGIEPGRHDTQSGEQHMGVSGRWWLQLFGTHVHAEWNTILSKK